MSCVPSSTSGDRVTRVNHFEEWRLVHFLTTENGADPSRKERRDFPAGTSCEEKERKMKEKRNGRSDSDDA
jgi:hypothetical protein